MTKKFTKLMAAFALLTFLAVPMGMWGQTTSTTSASKVTSSSFTWTDEVENVSWSGTVNGGATNQNMNNGYAQIGTSSSPSTSVTLSTSSVSGTITSVVLNCAAYQGKATVSATVGGSAFGTQNQSTPSWSSNSGGDVTFSGSASGTIVVTMTNGSGGRAMYIKSISVTYTSGGSQLTSTTTTITVPTDFNTDVNTSSTAGQLTATVTYDNSGTPTIVPNATVTWESNNEDVATVDGNGNVTLVAAGTSTITANYAGETGAYAASSATYLLEVISSAPYVQPTTIEANLNNSLFGTDYNGSANGISDSNPVVGTIHNVTVTYAGSGNHYINDSQIRFYPNNKLTFEAPDGYEITEIVFTASSWGITVKVGDDVIDSNTKTWTGSASEVVFTGSGSSGNCQMTKATITLAAAAPKYTLTAAMTNVAEYFVFVGDNEIEFDNNNQAQVSAGATVYVSLTMEDCYSLTSLTVNGSTTGVTVEEPGVYYSFVMPEGDATIGVLATQATQYTLTVAGLNNVTYTDMLAGVDSEEVTFTNNQATLCEGINVDIVGLSANTGLLLQSVTLNDGTTTTTLELEYGVYHFTMPSSNATLTFTTAPAPTYSLANSIESGKTYIIVYQETQKAMGAQNNNNRAAVGVYLANEKITVSSTDVYEFVISTDETNSELFNIYDAVNNGYLYAAGGSGSSASNYLKTQETLTDNGRWDISFSSDGNAIITAQGDAARNIIRYNNSSNIFSCYASGQKDVFLFVKDETPAGNTITVDGYGNTDGGYVLLAWPENTLPADIEGMISDNLGTDVTPQTSTYDLYSYDGSQEMEWLNYRRNNFSLVPGKGYLYASKEGVTLTYEGEANPEFVDVDLPYVADNKIQSLYLAGNSKTTAETFYVYNGELEKQSVNFLTMNGNGDGFITNTATSFEAQALQGFFVQSAGGDWTLSTADIDAKGRSAELLNVKVSQNRGTLIDNAIVSFGNASQLNKLYLFDNTTRVFIPQNGEEMAVVRSEAQGELPVSFRASENGTYTLSMNVENVDMNYLHLIDNMTGMDIDLLQTPSYTFEANTNDYANRFKLVFAANGANEADEASFAFFSDGNLIVNNEGNATLQVIDVNGRILSSETISGSCSKAINATTGVYMLRLINGDNVKVQKVVVR